MSLARAEKTVRGVDAESEDLPANCVSNSSDERMICARPPGCADPDGFAAVSPEYAPLRS